MNWESTPESRLVLWRSFRKSLEDHDLLESARRTAEWWAQVPTLSKISTPWATDTWPDPWTLLASGPLDHTLTSVAMAYSLWMVAPLDQRTRVTLGVLNDVERRQIILVPVIDNRWLINYNAGELTDMSRLDTGTEMLSSHAYEVFKSRIKA